MNQKLTKKITIQMVILYFFIALFKNVIFLDLPSGNRRNVIIGENLFQLYERFIEMFNYSGGLMMSRRSFYTKFVELLYVLGFEIEKEKGNTGVQFSILHYSDLVDFQNIANETNLSLDTIKELPHEKIVGYLETIANLSARDVIKENEITDGHQLVNFCKDSSKNSMILTSIANKLCIENGIAEKLLKLFYDCSSNPSKELFSKLYDQLIKNMSS